ncbi:MAG: tetratricopeptide repeat protein [Polaromonas sp.]
MTGRNDACPCGSGKKYKKCCLAKKPDYATNATNAGAASRPLLNAVALHQAGNLDGAETAYRHILVHTPGDSHALHYLGLVAFQKKKYAESVALIEQAIGINGDTPAFYCNLGNARMRLLQFEPARQAYQEACRLDPQFAVALMGLGNAQLACGHSELAVAAARQAVALAPQLFDAWLALGDALLAAELIDEAEQCYQRSLALRPGSAPALIKRANILTRFGQIDEANKCIAQAIHNDPGFEPAYWARLMNLNYTSSDQQVIHEAHLDWARRFAGHDTAQPMRSGRRGAAGGRLRVAYLSADFRRHALRFFIRPILRNHDRSRFEVYCYYSHAMADEVTSEIKALAEHWVDCHPMSDAELAQRIVADDIDVLVDLSGHTHGSRLKALAMKPAPVQATMLGYLCTTGLKAMDYRIVDPHTCPPGVSEAFQGETLARLPHCQWCYEPEGQAPIGPLPALANRHITFGCFHNLAKVTPSQLELFCEILQSLTDARLLMVVWGDVPRQHLLRLFAAAGLVERVQIIAPRGYADYLALYDQVDIGLDTFPYCGGTTSMESLWMGVPFVTMKGSTQASNGGASILSNVGLPQFIAGDALSYVEIARCMAADIEGLDKLRRTLRGRLEQSPIMNAPLYVRALESLFLGFSEQAAMPSLSNTALR